MELRRSSGRIHRSRANRSLARPTVVRIEIPVNVRGEIAWVGEGRLPAQHIGISGQREAADGRRADVQCRHGSRRTAAIGRITALFEMDLNRLRLPRVGVVFQIDEEIDPHRGIVAGMVGLTLLEGSGAAGRVARRARGCIRIPGKNVLDRARNRG